MAKYFTTIQLTAVYRVEVAVEAECEHDARSLIIGRAPVYMERIVNDFVPMLGTAFIDDEVLIFDDDVTFQQIVEHNPEAIVFERLED
jgi:hypothetical protein